MSPNDEIARAQHAVGAAVKKLLSKGHPPATLAVELLAFGMILLMPNTGVTLREARREAIEIAEQTLGTLRLATSEPAGGPHSFRSSTLLVG